jgi:UDP-3-O-[3-hydroxymyristoyl] glucosamine N-acyltransferase
MNLKLEYIINKLDVLNVTYKISHTESDTSYSFASIKNIISKGFYYLEKEYIQNASAISKSVILTNADFKDYGTDNIIVFVANPQLVHYQIASLLDEKNIKGIHATAIISDNASISNTAYIGPYCVVEDAIIDDNVQLLNNVIVRNNVHIKSNTVIEANSVIGAKGMSWIWDDRGNRVMQPQLGGVVIEENCHIGTDITIVRGALSENTKIGANCIISHGTKIGHGCVLEDFVHTANNVSLAGNAYIGERTFLGSGSTISSNVKLGQNCIVGAGTVLNKTININYATIVGVPAKIIKTDNFLAKPKGAPKPFKK